MGWMRPATGILLIAVGAVWAFQGYGTLKGSFMTGSPLWLWIGVGCVVAGAVLLVTAVRSSR
jgi:hypothetical protein